MSLDRIKEAISALYTLPAAFLLLCIISRALMALNVRISRPSLPSTSKSNVRGSRKTLLVMATQAKDNRLFIFGLGYSGLAACNYFRQKGWSVSGTCREEEKADSLRERGFDAYAFDADGIQQLCGPARGALDRATHILSTVPPDGRDDPVLGSHTSELAARADDLEWVGYLSSTSVYGDHKGIWVDESSELLAAHGKGVTRMLVEAEWRTLAYEFQLPVHIFRCGGIYGPRRSVLDSLIRRENGFLGLENDVGASQERRRQQRYTARCHVLDICRVLEASMNQPRLGAVYNIVDDDPSGREAVEIYAAQLLQVQAGRVVEGAATQSSRGGGYSRSEASSSSSEEDTRKKASGTPRTSDTSSEVVLRGEKRVRNDLIKQELEVELEFPSYREGIAALLAGDMRPFD